MPFQTKADKIFSIKEMNLVKFLYYFLPDYLKSNYTLVNSRSLRNKKLNNIDMRCIDLLMYLTLEKT